MLGPALSRKGRSGHCETSGVTQPSPTLLCPFGPWFSHLSNRLETNKQNNTCILSFRRQNVRRWKPGGRGSLPSRWLCGFLPCALGDPSGPVLADRSLPKQAKLSDPGASQADQTLKDTPSQGSHAPSCSSVAPSPASSLLGCVSEREDPASSWQGVSGLLQSSRGTPDPR